MKKETPSVQLIRNTYPLADAKEVIDQLLSDKMNFIRRKIFSMEEREGVRSPFLEKRLEEISASTAELNRFFEQLEEGCEIRIHCPISIEVVNKKSQSSTVNAEESKEWI